MRREGPPIADQVAFQFAHGAYTDMTDHGNEVHARVVQIPRLVEESEVLLHRGRYTDCDFMIEIDSQPYLASVRAGHISAFRRDTDPMSCWSFAVRGSARSWHKFWEPTPPPFFHDIFAMRKTGALIIEGDLRPLMSNLLYFKGVLAAPRHVGTR
jgi:hypothetical protein